MGKGRREREERAAARRAPAAGPAEQVAWDEIAALLPPRHGQVPPTTVPPRLAARPSAGRSAMSARAPARRPRGQREFVELARLAAERDQVREVLAAAEAAIAKQMHRERRAGASWGDIGQALGVSRQGARQRFGEG
ncbi:hypothetical protein [Cellulomonas sp. P24]|uniref:hypothetical protein n=1 Tax=Cellulomonas sp. P24 TaxID=2885206 RepID=UPI00216B394C|nr:hypothetical protein [Cellulomonas sp. P24]MCR6491637.1 hypothetical protein [Cellulomonas sp. P24]